MSLVTELEDALLYYVEKFGPTPKAVAALTKVEAVDPKERPAQSLEELAERRIVTPDFLL